MSQTIAAAASPVPAPHIAARRAKSDRRFYLIAAILMLLCTAGGFRNFYLHGHNPAGAEITPRILPFVVLHGLAMTGWVILFLVQSLFIQTGRRKLHMAIGPLGSLFGVAAAIFGLIAATYSAHFNPHASDVFGGARVFLSTMYAEMLLFGAFVALGYFYRRKPDAHRPMMLLATVILQSGSLGRLPYVWDLAVAPLYARDLVLIFGALLFVLQWAMTSKPNLWFLKGHAATALVAVVSVAIGNTSAWNRLVSSFVP
jgi:hypothetical protein